MTGFHHRGTGPHPLTFLRASVTHCDIGVSMGDGFTNGYVCNTLARGVHIHKDMTNNTNRYTEEKMCEQGRDDGDCAECGSQYWVRQVWVRLRGRLKHRAGQRIVGWCQDCGQEVAS